MKTIRILYDAILVVRVKSTFRIAIFTIDLLSTVEAIGCEVPVQPRPFKRGTQNIASGMARHPLFAIISCKCYQLED